jgi:hypothetical protein
MTTVNFSILFKQNARSVKYFDTSGVLFRHSFNIISVQIRWNLLVLRSESRGKETPSKESYSRSAKWKEISPVSKRHICSANASMLGFLWFRFIRMIPTRPQEQKEITVSISSGEQKT